jgi:hypothetical protein
MPNALVVASICLASVGAFGPHVLMVGFKVAHARPPAAVAYFCVLQHDGGRTTSSRVAQER